MSVHRICVHHVSVHSYSPSLSFLGRVGEGLKLYFYYFLLSTSYFLLHAPLKQSAGVFLGLLDVEAEHLRLYGREVYGAGLSLLDGIAVGIGHRLPLSLRVLVFNVPRLRNFASAPGLVVVPVDGCGLHLLWLSKGVGDPLRSSLFRPPMEIGYRTVVLVGGHQSVGNTLHRC